MKSTPETKPAHEEGIAAVVHEMVVENVRTSALPARCVGDVFMYLVCTLS